MCYLKADTSKMLFPTKSMHFGLQNLPFSELRQPILILQHDKTLGKLMLFSNIDSEKLLKTVITVTSDKKSVKRTTT